MTTQEQITDLGGVFDATSLALARLDAGRLEGIALSCEDLAHDCTVRTDPRRAERLMGEFKRLLELTNANLAFMDGLRSMRSRRLEYGRVPVKVCITVEVGHGNH
jgi:hypothetical protein